MEGTIMKRIIAPLAATLLVSAGLALSLGAGTAQANNQGPFQWCPGDPMSYPGPGSNFVWDMNICHTWYRVDYGKGNVPSNRPPPPESNIWDGEDPPPSTTCYPFCL